MVRRKSRRSSTPAAQRSAGSEATIVWGKDVEAGDYLKVPRVILARGRYPIEGLRGLKPRHLLLLLVLAGRKFKRSRIRAYWEELADDLEVSKDTVRKWAYELRDRGLLHIAQHRGRALLDQCIECLYFPGVLLRVSPEAGRPGPRQGVTQLGVAHSPFVNEAIRRRYVAVQQRIHRLSVFVG